MVKNNFGSMQKFVGETALWMPKSGFPHAPSRESSGRIKKQFFSLYFFRGKNADV